METDSDDDRDSSQMSDDEKNGKRNSQKSRLKKRKEKDIHKFFEESAESGSESESEDYTAQRRRDQTGNYYTKRKDNRLQQIANMTQQEAQLRYRQDNFRQTDEQDQEEDDWEDQDLKLFQVQVKDGKQKKVCFDFLERMSFWSQGEKSMNSKEYQRISQIVTISCVPHNKGYVYVEAQNREEVVAAFVGRENFLGTRTITLVPFQQRKKIFQIQSAPSQLGNIEKGRYCRINFPGNPYDGDLAQLMNRIDSRSDGVNVEVALVPRTSDDGQLGKLVKGEKRPQKNYFAGKQKGDKIFISQKELATAICKIPNQDQIEFNEDMCYQKRQLSTQRLDFEVSVDMTELKEFYYQMPTDVIYKLFRKPINFESKHVHDFQKNDPIRVIEGDFQSFTGQFVKYGEKDKNFATVIIPKISEEVEVATKSLVREFQKGDRVCVTQGHYKNSVGTILQTIQKDANNTIATIFTDNQNEIQVRINSLQPFQFTNSAPLQNLNQEEMSYRKFDFVKLTGYLGFGVVLSIDKDQIRLLNADNEVKTYPLISVEKSIDTRRLFTRNSRNQNISQGCTVFIIDGEYKNERGEVLHVYNNLVTVQFEKLTLNQGIMIFRDNNVYVTGFPPNHNPVAKINPEIMRLRGQQIVIKEGQYKGIQASVLEIINEETAKVQLITKCKKMSIPVKFLLGSERSNFNQIQTPAPQATPSYAGRY